MRRPTALLVHGAAVAAVAPSAAAATWPRAARNLRYLPGEPDPDVVRTKGIYLNRQLLEERLARTFLG